MIVLTTIIHVYSPKSMFIGYDMLRMLFRLKLAFETRTSSHSHPSVGLYKPMGRSSLTGVELIRFSSRC